MNKIKKVYRRFSSWMKYDPPGSMTTKGWRLFENEYKEKAPIRYWFMHDLKYGCMMPFKWKYEKVHDWIRYRTYDRYHIVDTGLEPGYHDVTNQMLHVNFNLLKEFVECEQAWSRYLWSGEYEETASWLEKHMPFYRRFVPFRRPDLGIAHFEWAATLDDPSLPPHERCDHQAVAAREILALYKWWVIDRPARKEIEYTSYDHQGMGMLGCFDDDFDETAEDYQAHRASMDAASKQEEDWEKEDEEMLIRLIKIRKSLWT
jgi:hypothetical protein